MEARTRIGPALVMCTMVFGSLTGCDAGDDAAEDVEVERGAVSTWPPVESGTFQYGRQWSWASNGASAVNLLPSSNNACFLSTVSGDLRSGDEVSVAISGGSQWVIRGSAPGGGSPAGNAFCMNGVSVTPRVDVVSGESKSMGVPAVTHSCFLASIRGPFNTAGSFVRLINTDTEWRLEAGGGAAGSARCVTKPLAPERSISSPGTEVQLKGVRLVGGIVPLVEDAVNTTADGPYFCALTRVQGHLRGFSGALVGTYLWPGGASPSWKLREGSYPVAVLYPLSGSARCAR